MLEHYLNGLESDSDSIDDDALRSVDAFSESSSDDERNQLNQVPDYITTMDEASYDNSADESVSAGEI